MFNRQTTSDIRYFLIRKTTMYPSVQALLSAPRLNELDFNAELQDLQEDLDAAVVQMRCTLCTNNNVELPSLQNLSTRERLHKPRGRGHITSSLPHSSLRSMFVMESQTSRRVDLLHKVSTQKKLVPTPRTPTTHDCTGIVIVRVRL
jgi:hypothetical protein